MPGSSDVTLPRSITPVFPHKCVVCHSKPDSTANVLVNMQEWPLASVLIPIIGPFLAIGSWSRVEVPICRACKWKFAWKTWSRRLLCIAPLVFLAIWFMPDFSAWPRIVQKLAVLAWALLFVVPYAIVEAFWPRLFAAYGDGDQVEYAFASSDYAAAFRVLNATHVIALA